MPVSRGVAYAPRNEADPAVGLLVLTDDLWNGSVDDVTVVPIAPREFEAPPFSPSVDVYGAKPAVVGMLRSVEVDELGAPITTLSGFDMGSVEDAFRELLGMDGLLLDPPRSSPMASGRQFPRWSHIYYGPERAGQTKRWVVLSDNVWNLATGGAVILRTTSKLWRIGPGYPAIQHGHAVAAAGDLLSVSSRRLDMRNLPRPPSLSIADMVSIAHAVLEVHGMAP